MHLHDTEQAALHLANISFQSRPDLFIAAADVAYELGNTQVVKEILKTVMISGLDLQDYKLLQNVQIILRSLIRISYDTLMESKTPESQTDLLGHMVTDCKLVKKALKAQDQNELDWFFRVAWNSTTSVSQMESTFLVRTQYFEIVMELYKLFQDPEETHTDCVEKACFMSIWYRLQLENQEHDEINIQKLQEAIGMWKDLTKLPDAVLFYEFELLCLEKDWDRAKHLIQHAQNRVLESDIWKKCCGICF
jgi:hypothetical protein